MHLVHLLVAALLSSSAELGPVQAPAARTGAGDTPSAIPASAPKRGADGKRVEFPGDEKKTLVGSYYAPKDPKKLAPLALLVPDAGGKRGDLAELADKLQKQGFAVLSVDLRGHGESVGTDKPWSQLSDADKLTTWSAARSDIKSAVKFLSAQPGVQKANLTLLGDRAGCTLVTDHAKHDESVRSIVMLDPPSVETLGFNLEKDVASLGGLPTFIAVTSEAEARAKDLAITGQKANNGTQFIEVVVFKGVSLAPVIDKGLPTAIAKFMDANANHKKGEDNKDGK